MTIEEILAGESKNVEFKENLPEKSIKYMKSVVAFANGTGGKIIFGIADKSREVVGHQRRIFAHIIAIGRAALEDEVCGVEIGAGQVLGDDQHLAPAGQDSVADVGVSGQIAAAHTADDGKVLFG